IFGGKAAGACPPPSKPAPARHLPGARSARQERCSHILSQTPSERSTRVTWHPGSVCCWEKPVPPEADLIRRNNMKRPFVLVAVIPIVVLGLATCPAAAKDLH